MTDDTHKYYYPEVVGGNITYTPEEGSLLAASAQKDKVRPISVVLPGSPSSIYEDTKALLDLGLK